MYNFGINAIPPIIVVANGFNRLFKALVGIIIIPLLLLAGFTELKSDFENIGPADASHFGFTSQTKKVLTDLNRQYNQIRSPVLSVGRRAMLLYPMMPDELFLTHSADSVRGKTGRIVYDSTIYMSSGKVDKPPQLIWMIYPDLSKGDLGNVSSIRITLNILVDHTGQPLDVTIADETLLNRSAKQIVLESARTSVFRPARKDNQSVKCWVQVPLELEVGE